jgi:hypothetical protein
MNRVAFVVALLSSIASVSSIAQAQQAQQAQQQAAQTAQQGATAGAEQLRRAAAANAKAQQDLLVARENAQLPLRLSLDPTRLKTIGLWPRPEVPCKLPKRDKPYACHRLIEGPVVIFSALPLPEVIVARGDEALAKGERTWWLHDLPPPVPLALEAGQVLYLVGEPNHSWEGEYVATVYR